MEVQDVNFELLMSILRIQTSFEYSRQRLNVSLEAHDVKSKDLDLKLDTLDVNLVDFVFILDALDIDLEGFDTNLKLLQFTQASGGFHETLNGKFEASVVNLKTKNENLGLLMSVLRFH